VERSDQVAIVGGGIGGLTAALGLPRHGIDVTVYEQATELKELGAGVQISPNGTKVLYSLGLGPEIENVGVVVAGKEIRLWSTGHLFDLGADICVPQDGGGRTRLRIAASQVAALEAEIDRYNEPLAPLTSFVLPGGSAAAAHLHVARAIVRRAERDLVELSSTEPVNEQAIKYLNRLSDLLFVLARYLNARGAGDVLWKPGANR